MPAEIRKKLRIGPDSILEWDTKTEEVIVRKTGRHTLADVHDALFLENALKRRQPQT